jgi:aryl-alcohol dehydrogenase-like predicted oxidoreductase
MLGRVDVFLLHSCEPRDDLVEPLVRARRAGLVRAIGYSGDGEGLAWAAGVEPFDVLECSINLFDQRALEHVGNGKRILAKRPLANAPWTDAERPERSDRATYWDRMQAMFNEPPTLEVALGFVLHSGVDCALVGTTRKVHLRRAFQVRPQPSDARERYARHGSGWPAVV